MPVKSLVALKREGGLGALLRRQRRQKGFGGLCHHGRGMDAGIGGGEQRHSHTDRENPQRSCLHGWPPWTDRLLTRAVRKLSDTTLAYNSSASIRCACTMFSQVDHSNTVKRPSCDATSAAQPC